MYLVMPSNFPGGSTGVHQERMSEPVLWLSETAIFVYELLKEDLDY